MLLTVDTGGTKTLLTYFNHDGKPTKAFRFPTPKDPDEYLAVLLETIHDNYAPLNNLEGVVIAVPGIVKKNIAVWCSNLGWENVPLARKLSKSLNVPVWLENDANLAGLAETRALRKTPGLSLYVTVSTGIGIGVILDGNIEPSIAHSEGGHMILEYDGKAREWESFASGRAITATYNSYARDIHSKKIWRQIADKISRGFLVLVPLLQPDVIIIGGSIGTYFDQYESTLRKILTAALPPQIKVPEIRQAAHPEEAVIYGCYYYGRDQLAHRATEN